MNEFIDYIRAQLATNQFFSAAALAGVLTSVVYSLRSHAMALWRHVVNRVVFEATIYDHDTLFAALEHYLATHHPRSYRNVEASTNSPELRFSGIAEPGMKPGSREKKVPSVHYWQLYTRCIIRFKNRYVLVSKGREKNEHAQSGSSRYFGSYTVSALWGAELVRDLLGTAVQEVTATRRSGEVVLYNHDQWGTWRHNGAVMAKPIDAIVMPGGLRDEILSDLREFSRRKDWYAQAHIPYKRGICLHGPPGNGKTTIAVAIAAYLQRPLYAVDLVTLHGDTEYKNAIGSLPDECVVVMEDIHTYFEGRQKPDGGKVSFSTVLNVLDGLNYRPGMVTIITTNHIGSLDEALIRPGRMDRVFLVPKPGIREINDYLVAFYGDQAEALEYYQMDYSMAEIQGICLRYRQDASMAKAIIAMGYLWPQKPEEHVLRPA